MSPESNTPSRSLPRVLYAIVLDPAVKFGSLEEQIICLARAFQARKSLFCPLFICSEERNGDTAFHAAGIETKCLDLRRFHWSQLVRLSRLTWMVWAETAIALVQRARAVRRRMFIVLLLW